MKLIKLYVLVFVLGGVFSCENPDEFLDVIPTGTTIPTTVQDFENLLNTPDYFFDRGLNLAGDTIIAYGISLGFPAAEAKFFTTLTLLAMVFTYALGVILIPKFLKQSMALKISAALGIIFSVGIISTTGFTSILFVAALGIANALVWPAIWPLTLEGLGKFTKTASALLIMSISGGAIIPPLYGILVDSNKHKLIAQGVTNTDVLSTSSTESYWILIPCYIIILVFAVWGYKFKSWKIK